MAECTVINCDAPAALEGWCGPHYNDYLKERKSKQEAKFLTTQQKKESAAIAKELDAENIESMIDLEWWFEQYGEQELPSKFMNRYYWISVNWEEDAQRDPQIRALAKLEKTETMLLNEALKELEGSPVNGGTHIWTFTGKKHFLREGTHNHFACLPV